METGPATRRPVTVLMGLVLVWAALLVGIVDAVGVYPETSHDGLGLHFLAVIAVYSALMIVTKWLAGGAHWARIVFVIILVAIIGGMVQYGVAQILALEREQVEIEQSYEQRFEAEIELLRRCTPVPCTTIDAGVLLHENGCEGCLTRLEWKLIHYGFMVAQAAILAVAIFLLFTPSANRWFQPAYR